MIAADARGHWTNTPLYRRLPGIGVPAKRRQKDGVPVIAGFNLALPYFDVILATLA
jgi:hypothetical protein